MTVPRSIREALLAVSLLAFGLICLPVLIYVVGQRLIGEYEAGLAGFYDAIGSALAGGSPFAWLLILSPYISIQLIRFVLWLRRQRKPVN